MNKKGQIAIGLILIVALILIGTILFSFITFNSNVNDEREEINNLVNRFDLGEAYINNVFEDSVEKAIVLTTDKDFSYRWKEFEDVVDERDLRLSYGGNFFGKVRTGEYNIISDGEFYNLTMEGVFVSAEVGKSKIEREFDLMIRFNGAGIVD